MIIVVLLLLGLCMGSFVNALVWRLNEQSKPLKKRAASDKELSISKGRSMCVNCKHTLHIIDLLPVVSWLALKGKCRYCRKPISWQYPAVEIATAMLFIASYIFWPFEMDAAGILGLVVWLVSLVGLMALVVYDFRWMLLPNKIVSPLVVLVLLATIIDALFFSRSYETLVDAIGGAAVGGGIFYALFQISNGKWIGGGDVKLGFLLGLLVASPLNALLVIFIASLLGTFLILPLMISKKVTKQSKIPFGPFLIAGAIITMLFGERLIESYLAAIGL